MVGRSKPFSVHLHKELSGLFPAEFKNASADDLYRAVNVVKQSPIRIEADEVTYNLHIILRMELERALIQGDIDVADLPDQWNESMRKYLGITPADNSQGVLQDIHWSAGAFGYFPTYTLGNLYSAQFMSAAERALPELNSQIERGELLPLLHWMRENIHQHGRRYSAGELCERATGSPLAIDPFVNYLESKYTELYSL
jgi:carboxypeptidase Taq